MKRCIAKVSSKKGDRIDAVDAEMEDLPTAVPATARAAMKSFVKAITVAF